MRLSYDTRYAGAALVAALACFRLCHVHLLWADEDYHLAAAIHILHGKIPYRDFWYDKPPLNAAYYLLIGGHAGWLLRVLDVFYVLLACHLAYRLARAWWGEAEGWTAAFLLAFFTIFYLPSAVIPFAADALMLAPHLAAMYFAREGRPFWAGLYAGIAFLVNPKAVFVLAACAVWLMSGIPALLAAFAIPVIAGFLPALAWGAWAGYCEQVWRWGLIYARGSPVTDPFRNGLVRTSHWIGFHSALAAGVAFAWLRIARDDRWKLGAWLALSFAAVCLGTRFAPHYFFQMLAPMVIIASRGIVLAFREYRKPAAVFLAICLAVPLIRFGPRYASLALDNLLSREPHWSDVAMDLDSQHAARKILSMARPNDSLFVWGYRPDLYVYTRMTSDSLFWDSQPLTGVPADRHLWQANPIYGGPAAENRQQLIRSHPAFMVDGLGIFNPKLKPGVYPELRPWLAHYKLMDQTALCQIYRRVE
ncbi:MAG: hypothetical protein WB992_18555 [Bryobacteraceae bacterium]